MNNNNQQHFQKLFKKAATRLQSGEVAEAKKLFIQLSKKAPNSIAIWYNLGLCHQHLQQHARAVEIFEKALQLERSSADAWVNLGISYKELGDTKKAIDAANKAMAINPAHSRALNLSASLDAENNEPQSAREKLQQSLKLEPGNRDALINLINLETDENNLQQAEHLITPFLAADSANRELRIAKSKILLAKKEFSDAASGVLALAKEFPDDETVLRLNLSYREVIKDHFGAINIAENLLKRAPNDALLWNSLGGAYFQLDGVDKSRQCYEKAVKFAPEHPEYANNLGLVYSSLGDKEGAERYYRLSLQLNPMHAEAYRNIVTMKKFSDLQDPDAKAVIALWQNPEIDDFQRIKTAFALGKIYDDCGFYDQAFEVYKIGNELKFKDSSIDLNTYYRHIDTIPQILNTPPRHFASQKSASKTHPKTHPKTQATPIFILGMPRSGTTLIEQVLSRHSRVEGFGELPCIERAITRLEKKSTPMRAYPSDFGSVSADELSHERQEYLNWVGKLHDLKTPFFTDKMPFNFMHIWLIKALFPESPIIHCRRHPLDVITSNYFQLYGSDISFVYQLEALANYYVRYHKIMAHWNSLFAEQIINVVYEKFVAESEQETQRLIKATNLDWQDGCLEQNIKPTAVRTASIWQVRQGIYTSSRERWRHYEKHLSAVMNILCEQGILDSKGNWLAGAL